jgi:DNA-binding MarR family transcriptional regulator
MYKSYFEARDDLDAAIDAGDLTLTGPENAVLQYLVARALYRGSDYGWVALGSLGVGKIAHRLGISEKTVKRALTELTDRDFVMRKPRPQATGGRDSDLIKVLVLFDDAVPKPPKGSQSPFPEGDSLSAEGVTESLSLLTTEELS